MWTVQFWKDALERAGKSAAQALLLLWAGDGVFDLFNVPDWKAVAGIAGGAAVLSLLTSVATGLSIGQGTASAVDEVVYTGRHAARE